MKYLSILRFAGGFLNDGFKYYVKAGCISGTITIGRTWGISEDSIKSAEAQINSRRHIQKSVEDKN